jgi:ATP-dependent Clp protease, protease subunit
MHATTSSHAGAPFLQAGNGHASLHDAVFDRLLRERVVVLGSQVDDDIANQICAQMLLLSADDPRRDVHLYINSPGGSVTSALAIYDTIEFIKPDVTTICMGQAASAAAILLAAGTKGKRFALPHARILIHQPHGGAEGQSSDIEIQAREIQRIRDLLDQILADKTGQPLGKITTDTDRDFIMTAQEAVEYGIIDQVLQSRRLQEVQLAAS